MTKYGRTDGRREGWRDECKKEKERKEKEKWARNDHD